MNKQGVWAVRQLMNSKATYPLQLRLLFAATIWTALEIGQLMTNWVNSGDGLALWAGAVLPPVVMATIICKLLRGTLPASVCAARLCWIGCGLAGMLLLPASMAWLGVIFANSLQPDIGAWLGPLGAVVGLALAGFALSLARELQQQERRICRIGMEMLKR